MLEEPLFVYDDKKKKWVRRNVRYEDSGKMYFIHKSKFVYSKRNKMDLFKNADIYKSVVAPSSYYYRMQQPAMMSSLIQPPTFLFYIPSKNGKHDLWINFNSANQLGQWVSKIRSSLTTVQSPPRSSLIY